VRDRIRKWYGSRWFAPNRLKSAALTDTLHGIYLPYWTFDAHASARWRADAGHYYYETERVRGADGRTPVRQVRRVRRVPAPGTRGIPTWLLRRIEPFPTASELVPYAPEYVRGWTVERYQVDLHEAHGLNRETMQAKLRALCARQVPGDTHRNLQVEATWRGR